ncbi:MAG: gpW family protein [Alphaproteobacteria bacterium]|nr:gpW family protein [Alphaproteobacteria bacterium]
MALDKETIKTRLAEAEEAYHKLLIGAKEVSVNVGNFGSVTYNQTSHAALEAYIADLKAKLAEAEGSPVLKRKIIKVSF